MTVMKLGATPDLTALTGQALTGRGHFSEYSYFNTIACRFGGMQKAGSRHQ
jgi:hypothetical protein